jgi:transcriptional regulator with XRE-family HTH domain
LMSVAPVAVTAGVATETIVGIEHGRSVVGLATMKALSEALTREALEIEEFRREIEGEE